MLELKTKKELGTEAHKLAKSFELIRHRGNTYLPADFETGLSDPVPDPDRTIWAPLDRDGVRRLASAQFNTLFGSDSELSGFDFMVAQNSVLRPDACDTLLVRTKEGLRELDTTGKLRSPGGGFVANTLVPLLNEDKDEKQRVFGVLSDWVDSDEEAHSMLHHMATALSPGWSAVKYVMLLGEGRNGKSLLLRMLQSVFGWTNVSNVTRQQVAEQNPVVTQLNGKLLNVVFDGLAEYVKDSGMEKSLIAGEQIPIRKLYESTPTPVQTNALFIEGLNHEPKSKDKSMALQKRIVRYHFPNVYALDRKFERLMLSDESLGAFLSLLIDHYVREEELATKLAPTAKAVELQIEHMFINSMGLQFLKHLDEHDPLGTDELLGLTIGEVAERFKSWRIKENDLGQWAEPDVAALFTPILNTDRKSVRADGKIRKVRVVTSFKPEALAFLDTLQGDNDGEAEDRAVPAADEDPRDEQLLAEVRADGAAEDG